MFLGPSEFVHGATLSLHPARFSLGGYRIEELARCLDFVRLRAHSFKLVHEHNFAVEPSMEDGRNSKKSLARRRNLLSHLVQDTCTIDLIQASLSLHPITHLLGSIRASRRPVCALIRFLCHAISGEAPLFASHIFHFHDHHRHCNPCKDHNASKHLTPRSSRPTLATH